MKCGLEPRTLGLMIIQTASFSTSYNLVWTPEQVELLLATSEANVEHYAMQMIKQVALKVYRTKKRTRLEQKGDKTQKDF